MVGVKFDDKPTVSKYFPADQTKSNEGMHRPLPPRTQPLYVTHAAFLFRGQNSRKAVLETLSKISKSLAEFMAPKRCSVIYRCHGDARCAGKFAENVGLKSGKYREKFMNGRRYPGDGCTRCRGSTDTYVRLCEFYLLCRCNGDRSSYVCTCLNDRSVWTIQDIATYPRLRHIVT